MTTSGGGPASPKDCRGELSSESRIRAYVRDKKGTEVNDD